MQGWRVALAAFFLLFPGLATPGASQQQFNWTISSSTTDPWVNSGPIAPGPSMFAGNLYLWFCGTGSSGLAAAEFDVVELQGAGLPTAFNPMNGFLNAGSASALLLAVGGCPAGPLLAGAFLVGPDSFLPDIELCLAPSSSNSRNVTMACDQNVYTNEWTGFRKTGAPCATTGSSCQVTGHCGLLLCNPDGSCYEDFVFCDDCQQCTEDLGGVYDCADCAPVSVESLSWGRMKSLYE